MKRLKNYNEDDFLSRMLFLYFSFLHGAIGIFLVFNDISQYGSKTFKMMSNLMPMRLWGLIFLVAGICYVLSALQEGRPKYAYMLLAGFLGSIIFGLAAIANAELSIDMTNTVNYAIISSLDLLIAMVGGVALWTRK